MELSTLQGQPASILGLAGQQSIDAATVAFASKALINYFFFYNLQPENFLDGLKLLLAAKREQVLVATGSEDRDISSLNWGMGNGEWGMENGECDKISERTVTTLSTYRIS